MRFFSIFTLCAAVFLGVAADAHAAAWTQDAGRGQVIVTGSYADAGSYWDTDGRKHSQPAYGKYELNPYLEYGLADGLTAGANIYLDRANQLGDTRWGLGDSEFFLRKRLWQGSGFVVSAQPMIKIPGPNADDSPQFGGTRADAGLGLSTGYGFSAWGLDHYADIDTQYRHRFGDPKDQINLAGTLGLSATPRLMFLPQAFLTYRTSKPAVASFTNSAGDDYNLFKLQLSAVYKATNDISLQVGGFASVSGKNTGEGNGVLFAVWKNF